MIYILTALRAEALPLIHHFSLREITHLPFPLYHRADVTLIVSGMGSRNAAAATAHLLTKFPPSESSRLLNIGICGAQESDTEIGTLFQIAKIIDPASESVYHLKNREQFAPKGRVASFEHPQRHLASKYQLIDMESIGLWIAGRHFLPTERIYLFKVVSDHLSIGIPKKGFVEGLIERHLPTFERAVATDVA